MRFKNLIRPAFGAVDGKFGRHPSDELAAVDLLRVCVEDNVALQDLVEEVTRFLRAANARQEHIDEQIQDLERRFAAWLD